MSIIDSINIIKKEIDKINHELVEEPKPKKKVKLYAFISKDFLHLGMVSVFYATKEESDDYLLMRAPEFDKEVEL
jgi:hypothetical protein